MWIHREGTLDHGEMETAGKLGQRTRKLQRSWAMRKVQLLLSSDQYSKLWLMGDFCTLSPPSWFIPQGLFPGSAWAFLALAAVICLLCFAAVSNPFPCHPPLTSTPAGRRNTIKKPHTHLQTQLTKHSGTKHKSYFF